MGYRHLEILSEGSPGHGSIHLLSASAAEVGFRWVPLALGWSRPGPLLSDLAGPLQHFRAAMLRGVARCWMCMALCSSWTLLMSGKEIRLCFGVFWVVVFGTVFFLAG